MSGTYSDVLFIPAALPVFVQSEWLKAQLLPHWETRAGEASNQNTALSNSKLDLTQ